MKVSVLLFAFPFLASFSLAEEKPVSFLEEIKPILRDRCVHCHNRKTLEDKVSFETAKLAFTKNQAGQSYIEPGKPDESLMVIALESPQLHANAMPIVGPRPSKEDVVLIRRWIKEGAEWPKGLKGRIKPTFYPTE